MSRMTKLRQQDSAWDKRRQDKYFRQWDMEAHKNGKGYHRHYLWLQGKLGNNKDDQSICNRLL